MRWLDDPHGSQFSLSMSRAALRRYRAERLLRKGFPEQRAKVLAIVRSQLRAKGIALDHADLEGCYAQAFHGLYATVLAGEEVENPSAWLVLVTFRRAIDESRAAARHKVGGQAAVAPQANFPAGHPVSDPDIAGALDNRAILRQVFEGLRASLSARECEAASLCYLQGLTRAQAAKRMGIGEARMRKLMEGIGPGRPGVASKVGELLGTIKAGGWCEQQSSLMRAYAFGILDPGGERHGLAASHCRDCPACRAYVASLRGLAAALPPLPLSLALAGGSGAVAAGTGGGVGGGVGSAAGSGPGIGVGGGLIGGAGSLAAKLAVLAVVTVGAGYAVTGGRARDNSRPAPAQAAPALSPAVAGTLSASPPAALNARTRARARSPIRRSTLPGAGPRHRRPAHGARSAAEAAAREFTPERVRGEASVAQRSTATSLRGGAPAVQGEFGFE
jgi:DNA-directed RNA polymerase specialized sigma24 family protein